ncbi:MAG TPA: exonuclease SbcCD subunit D [Ktedonobacterales bacterium]|nr:exonuclease SbcCD subunit D [Ktedonobacterales bacterium]
MRAIFVHTADNHLGYEQYGLKERFNDFAKAFFAVAEAAIERRADAFLIAGDLFNKRAIDAQTLMQAQTALHRLKEAGIPAIAIEGNHDRSYYRDGTSWLQFLCWQGVLILLNPHVEGGIPELTPWDPGTLHGAYYDVKPGLRVYGLPWYGANTARVMDNFAEVLLANRTKEDAEGVDYRVLMMHTGVEGIVPQLHGLPTYEQFQPLRGLVDYVALGHIHKSYVRDGWLYNPGSTETWGAEESAWDRGYFAVSVETEVPEGEPHHTAAHLTNPRRPFLRFTCRVDGLPNPAALYERFERLCTQWAAEHPDERDADPIVDISLSGILGFDHSAIDRPRLEELVREHFTALAVRVHDNARDSEWEIETDDDENAALDRESLRALELHVFQELLARDTRYLPAAPQWARVLAELKQSALTGDEPAHIAARLREARAQLMKS